MPHAAPLRAVSAAGVERPDREPARALAGAAGRRGHEPRLHDRAHGGAGRARCCSRCSTARATARRSGRSSASAPACASARGPRREPRAARPAVPAVGVEGLTQKMPCSRTCGSSSVSNSSTSRPRSSSAAWRRTSRKTGELVRGLLGQRLELAAALRVVEHAEPAVVGAQRADAGVARAAVEERGRQAVGGRRGELGGEEGAALLARRSGGSAAAAPGRRRTGPCARSAASRCGCPTSPVLALLADEVDADRPPVADQVVEEEPRRAVRLVGVLEVAVEHPLPAAPVDVVAGDRLGLEHQQHAAGEVGVGVRVEPDARHEVVAEDPPAEHAAAAGRVRAERRGRRPPSSGARPSRSARRPRARAQSSSLRRVSSRRPQEPNSTTHASSGPAGAPRAPSRRAASSLARPLARRGQVRELAAEPLERARGSIVRGGAHRRRRLRRCADAAVGPLAPLPSRRSPATPGRRLRPAAPRGSRARRGSAAGARRSAPRARR